MFLFGVQQLFFRHSYWSCCLCFYHRKDGGQQQQHLCLKKKMFDPEQKICLQKLQLILFKLRLDFPTFSGHRRHLKRDLSLKQTTVCNVANHQPTINETTE